METTKTPSITSSLIKGLLISLVVIAIQTTAQLANFNEASWFKFAPVVVLVVALVLNGVHYSKQMSNNVIFGKIFGYGFKTTAVIALVMMAYSVLLFTVISPELKEQAIQQARDQMEKENFSEEKIKSAILFLNKNFILITSGTSLFVNVFVGAIASLLSAAVAKKKPIYT